MTIAIIFFLRPDTANVQTVININAQALLETTAVFPSPTTGSFLQGSTFDIPIILDTKGNNVNTVELHINFDPAKLTIVSPSGDKSIIAVWLEPPTYSNVNGTAKLIGIIPNGITTQNGLIATVKFKAIGLGEAKVRISQATRVLLNDGAGTETMVNYGTGIYTILPVAPEGPRVFSITHPRQDLWHNNNSPVFEWDKDPGVTNFSYLLDDKPFTVPENIPLTSSTIKFYENLRDGLSYFHIKALKNGVWGSPSHFLVRIDTTPPAKFEPSIDFFRDKGGEGAFVSFFTTDNISGIDHYEVGIVEAGLSLNESPGFIEVESPYRLPLLVTKRLKVLVRAFDKAGNPTDVSVEVAPPILVLEYLNDHLIAILAAILIFLILLWILHYLIGHRIIGRFRRAMQLIKKEGENPPPLQV